MQRRSSGSDDGDDSSNGLPVIPDATRTPGQSTNSKKSLDSQRRTSADLRPSSARSRRSSNFNWRPSSSQNGSIDKAPLLSSAESPPATPISTSTPARDDDDLDDIMDKMSDPGSQGRRPRARSPWLISILTCIVSLVGIAFLALILDSVATRCRDEKGCRMSYMRPSYVELKDFDTEHTRFASKYSLHLYREQGIDNDFKVWA